MDACNFIAQFVSSDSHRNSVVRRTAAQYLATVVEKMGPNKCLLGPRDVAEQLLPAAASFVLDSTSPLTRFYGRVILATLYQHPQFEKLMRRFLTPPVYRSVSGILESVKRRVRCNSFRMNLFI